MFPCKRIAGFSLFIVLLTQGAMLSLAQEPSATPSPSPQETPVPSINETVKPPFEEAFQRLEWRSIGPANMGGRTADVGDLETHLRATGNYFNRGYRARSEQSGRDLGGDW